MSTRGGIVGPERPVRVVVVAVKSLVAFELVVQRRVVVGVVRIERNARI